MGIEVNKVVVATTWSEETAAKIQGHIETLSLETQELFASTGSLVNGKTTFIMGADGSKEGWPDAIHAAQVRREFIELLDSFTYDDNSSPVDYCSIEYGERGAHLRATNTIDKYA